MLKITRRKLQVILGSLWILDGCLQLQPKMFSSKFISYVIKPAQVGQPFYITSPIHFMSSVFISHPALFNGLIAATQVSIGLLIIYKLTTKYGLWLSVLWGVFVWFFGEAAAGLFSGQANLMFGLPGAAILMAILSLSVIPKDKDNKKYVGSWLIFIWAAIWIAGGIYQLLPTQNSIKNINSVIKANTMGAPHWLVVVDHHFLSVINHSSALSSISMASDGFLVVLGLAVLEIIIGLAVLINKNLRMIFIGIGCFLSLIFWFVGQSLGGYFTGFMTDVQTAPLLILLGLSVLSTKNLQLGLKVYYHKLEKLLV